MPFSLPNSDFVFNSKRAALRHFQAMLRVFRGQVVPDYPAEQLKALLLLHSKYAKKIGCGVDYFEVARSSNDYNSWCFWVVRTDGTREDFSLHKCLQNNGRF